MALAATQKQKATTKPPVAAEKAHVFAWEGMDRKGNRVKGETRAPNLTVVRADLRRQGVNPTKVKKKADALFSGQEGHQDRRHLALQPPARDHDGRRRAAGAVLRHRRPRSRQRLDAGPHPVHQGRHRERHGHGRGTRQAPTLFRRPVLQSGRRRRAGGRPGHPAGQDRHLQGKDRVHQGQGQEGDVLPRLGHRRSPSW